MTYKFDTGTPTETSSEAKKTHLIFNVRTTIKYICTAVHSSPGYMRRPRKPHRQASVHIRDSFLIYISRGIKRKKQSLKKADACAEVLKKRDF